MSKARVVVTGMGVVTPNAIGLDSFEDALRLGKSGIQYLPQLEQYKMRCRIGGVAQPHDSAYFPLLEKFRLSGAADFVLNALVAGFEAWEDSGFDLGQIGTTEVDYDTGIILGSMMGANDMIGSFLVPNIDSGNIKKLRSNIVEYSMFSAPTADLAGLFGLGNLNATNSSACATGTEAFVMGYERIANGLAKRMLVGGTEGYAHYSWATYDVLRITNRKYNDRPEEASRPMSASPAGFVPGSGCGVLVLEELETALKRSAKIYCEVLGGAVNAGGQRNGGTMTAPSPEGARRCISTALQNSGLKSTDIDYICGHLTSTKADVLEIQNWAAVLNRKGADFPKINALKSMIGHLIAAAGSVELIAAILQMQNQFVHPSLNCDEIHSGILEEIDKDCIVRTTLDKFKISKMMKASFGFGDVNACAVLSSVGD